MKRQKMQEQPGGMQEQPGDAFDYIVDALRTIDDDKKSNKKLHKFLHSQLAHAVIDMLYEFKQHAILPASPTPLEITCAMYVASCCILDLCNRFDLEQLRQIIELEVGDEDGKQDYTNQYETAEFLEIFMCRFHENTNVQLQRIRRVNKHGAQVWLCQEKQTRRMYAVKEVPHDAQGLVECSVVMEIIAHWKMRQGTRVQGADLIVKMQGLYFGTVERCHRVSMMMFEYHPLSMEDLPVHFDDNIAIAMCKDVFTALDAVHSHNIAHRDIKPQNMLVDACTGKLLLIDFNSASMYNNAAKNTVPITTIFARPPEESYIDSNNIGGKYDAFKLDIWSAACLCMNILLRTDADICRRYEGVGYCPLFIVGEHSTSASILHDTNRWINMLIEDKQPSSNQLSYDSVVAAYQVMCKIANRSPELKKIFTVLRSVFVAALPKDRKSAMQVLYAMM